MRDLDLDPIIHKYKSEKARIVNSITDPGEAVSNFSFVNNYLYIESDAVAYKAINVPWFAESETDDFLKL